MFGYKPSLLFSPVLLPKKSCVPLSLPNTYSLSNLHRAKQIVARGTFVALLPEHFHGGGKCLLFVELPWSSTIHTTIIAIIECQFKMHLPILA
jgi:hypothetical protein